MHLSHLSVSVPYDPLEAVPNQALQRPAMGDVPNETYLNSYLPFFLAYLLGDQSV